MHTYNQLLDYKLLDRCVDYNVRIHNKINFWIINTYVLLKLGNNSNK